MKVGRLQIFNNWSPYMVADPDTVWVGLEFFAKDDDDALGDVRTSALKALALREMQQLKLADEADALDAVVIRQPKAYPGYFRPAPTSSSTTCAATWTASATSTSSAATACTATTTRITRCCPPASRREAILADSGDKSAIWGVNIDDDYHEEAEKK